MGFAVLRNERALPAVSMGYRVLTREGLAINDLLQRVGRELYPRAQGGEDSAAARPRARGNLPVG